MDYGNIMILQFVLCFYYSQKLIRVKSQLFSDRIYYATVVLNITFFLNIFF